MTKHCKGCDQHKPEDGWSPSLWSGERKSNQLCRVCKAIANRAWKYKNRYGITFEDYDRMLREQGGHCALCPWEPTAKKRLMVDHCHETGAVRGLLCPYCNSSLGAFGPGDEAGLLRALAYVRQIRK